MHPQARDIWVCCLSWFLLRSFFDDKLEMVLYTQTPTSLYKLNPAPL